ncbi:MAG: hypothetical protein WCW67_02625 [Candidatus Margulisiibacteriota bacterium]|jgi:hypothetical protein
MSQALSGAFISWAIVGFQVIRALLGLICDWTLGGAVIVLVGVVWIGAGFCPPQVELHAANTVVLANIKGRESLGKRWVN